MKPRKCRECGMGTIQPVAKTGRIEFYKGVPLTLPSHIEIPTCDNCGAEWMNRNVARLVDAALEEEYQQALRARFDWAIRILRRVVSLTRLERILKLSQGYLSRLRSSKARTKLNPTLVAHLMLLARKPKKRIREAETLWGTTPPKGNVEERVVE